MGPLLKLPQVLLEGQEADYALRADYRVIPILKLQFGLQGWNSAEYRLENRTQKFESFKQRTPVITVTNSSQYLNYDLFSIVGFRRDKVDSDDSFHRVHELNR